MANVEVKYTQNFINNEFVDAVDKKTFDTINPVNTKVIAKVAEGDKPDIDLAVAAAKKAFEWNSEWRRTDASQRGVLLTKLADLLVRDIEYLSKLETLDNGKPVANAKNEVFFATTVLRYYAGLADKIQGSTIPADGEVFSLTLKEPVGICAQIIPYNYPLPMFIWKIAPAVAAGCTVVVKPAEQTPLTALSVAALIKEAGFPAGVINVVNGFGPTAGAALSNHLDVSKVSFTGSTEVGKIIMSAAANSNLKRVTLELGGKSPLIVLDDADVEKAAKIASSAAFSNQGQCCAAATRTYVQAGVYDKFVQKAAEYAKARKVGNPYENVDQGPQIDAEMYTKVLRYIDAGKKEGARLVAGGKKFGSEGYFIEPTVFADVTDNMTIAREEILGPVQSIFKFDTFEEAIERANDTIYGLGAGIITHNIDKAIAFAKAVRAGSVWVNTYDHAVVQTPSGGYKQSGIGRELGFESINNYLETKTITIAAPHKLQ